MPLSSTESEFHQECWTTIGDKTQGIWFRDCTLHNRVVVNNFMEGCSFWNSCKPAKPWNAEWSRSKNNRVLPRKCTGHSKHSLPTTQEQTLHMEITRWSTPKYLFQQHKRRLYTWTSPDGQHQNQIDSILCSQRWRSSIQSTKTRPGADCGSDHELLITNNWDWNWRKQGKPLDHSGMTSIKSLIWY